MGPSEGLSVMGPHPRDVQISAGTELADVVKTTVYVASSQRSDLVSAWNVVRAGFGDHDAPRRPGLAWPRPALRSLHAIRATPRPPRRSTWIHRFGT
jgi:hypothetical protein